MIYDSNKIHDREVSQTAKIVTWICAISLKIEKFCICAAAIGAARPTTKLHI
ncbi:MAG: hypothetical protein WBA89_28195 [Microcoleus sp.]|uniref:hypothetical protein n=1 Tax=Microcoleus sp. TaxID=44472 RepID=UPI003C73083B